MLNIAVTIKKIIS